MSHNNRGTIIYENVRVLMSESFPGDQYIVRLEAPRIAARAGAGSFVHLRCSDDLPMRRPMSVMRINPDAGTFDVLFKDVGEGTHRLARQPVGAELNALGPIGQCFTPDSNRPRALLVGGGVGIPPMLQLATTLADQGIPPALVIMGSEVPFPFADARANDAVAGVGLESPRCVPELESAGIASRLASTQGYDGCFSGYVTDLATAWLDTLDTAALDEVAVYACGPNPMLYATARLAHQFGLPCQVSLEEFMACGVGGCAGCTVLVKEDGDDAMRRVCVDGPVFEGDRIQWSALGFGPL
ncbi:MAG: dihydroorotate dehydrogenase electron transfer subunit [Pseudomonadota bacterium]